MRVALTALAYTPDLDPFDPDDACEIAECRRRQNAVLSAIESAAQKGAHAIWFSGYTAAVSRLANVESTGVVKALRQAGMGGVFELVEPGRAGRGIAKGKSKAAVSETGMQRAYFVYDPEKLLAGPFYQRAVRSNHATRRTLDELTKELSRKEARRFTTANVDCALLICGESNVLRTSQSNQQTGLRYKDFNGWLDYRLIFNPQHSVWRRSEIDKRLDFLSRQRSGQIAVSCANYPEGKESLARIIRVARGGRLDKSTVKVEKQDGYILRVLDA